MFDQEKTYQSVPELAQTLGITRDAVYKKIKRNEIPASKVGRNFASDVEDNQYISIAQLAQVLGISRIAVYKRVKKGTIQATRVGRNHLISITYIKEVMGEDIFEQVCLLFFPNSNSKTIKETKTHYSIPELARLLGLTRDAVYKKIKRGDLKATKVGRNYVLNSDGDDYVTIPQLARELGISRIAVYKKVKNGKIKSIRSGKSLLVSKKYLAEEHNIVINGDDDRGMS